MVVVSSQGSRAGVRLPRGPHRLTSEEVAADQRARLLTAMTHLAGTKGYYASSVAELIDYAGVSRKTFYALFANRTDLLIAAFAQSAGTTLAEARQSAGGSHRRGRRLEALARRLCRSARENPGANALRTIEIAAAKPTGAELRATFMDSYAELLCDSLGNDAAAMPAALAATLAGALHRQLDAHLRAGRAAELPELAPQLARWVRSYHPVPDGLEIAVESQQSRPGAKSNSVLGGRAPGTLSLAATYLPPISKPSREFVAHTSRERILDAVAQLNAEQGYAALTADAIAARTELPPRLFRAYFTSIEDSFAAAMELGHMRGQALVERARAWTLDWSGGVVDALDALLEFLASEPYFTRLAFVDAPLAGPALALRTSEHATAYARLLLDGAPRRRRPPEAALEAIGHALFEILYRHAAQGHTAGELRRATAQARYVALAPFVGVTDAAKAAAAV
jgi:AcrR family transcriptional regulator